jgi:hypothetical protein
MANRVIVGIIGTCDPSKVEAAVAATGLDRASLRVLTSQDETPAHEESGITFIHVAEVMGSNSMADEMTRGTGVLPDSGGTAVPGINSQGPSFDAFTHEEVLDHLDGVALPPGDAEFYNEAIDDGRCVVVCSCDDASAQSAGQALEKAGLTELRSF